MPLTSDQVNYLVWRYLQEEGLELAAHALDKESSASTAEIEYGTKVPRAELVRLLLRGLQMEEIELNAAASAAASASAAAQKPATDELEAHAYSGAENGSAQPAINGAVGAAGDAIVGTTGGATVDPDALVPVLAPGATSLQYADSVLALGTPTADTLLLRDGPAGHAETALVYAEPNTPEAHVTCVSWQPGNAELAVGAFSGSIRIWTAAGALGKVLAHHTAPITELKWNKDATLLLSVDCSGATAVWDTAEGVVRQSQPPASDGPLLVNVEWIDTRTYASTHPDGTPVGGLAIYKVSDAAPHVRLRGHGRAVSCLAFDPVSQLLASGGDDAVVNIWHARSPAPIRVISGHRAPITVLSWLGGPLGVALDGSSIASRLLTGSADGTVTLWDINALPPSPIWTIAAPGAVTLLSQTNSLLAIVGEQLVVYRLPSPSAPPGERPLLIGEFNHNGILSLSWSGDTLACATREETAVFSDLASRAPLPVQPEPVLNFGA